MKNTLAVGRFALGLIFLASGVAKFLAYGSTLGQMQAQGIPLSGFLLPVAAVIEIVGSSLLILGVGIPFVSLLLAAYLVPVTLAFHGFWKEGDPVLRQMQTVQFLKNISIFGALVLTYGYQRVLNSFSAGTLTTIRRKGYEPRRAA
ncbi:MAG: hypothetical protein RJB38_1732 [Pseudomonadota bacterium]|jgi:uncharacterized membrane protein YphA (DoxX/SURF4 family)